jgi:hypothetical protein
MFHVCFISIRKLSYFLLSASLSTIILSVDVTTSMFISLHLLCFWFIIIISGPFDVASCSLSLSLSLYPCLCTAWFQHSVTSFFSNTEWVMCLCVCARARHHLSVVCMPRAFAYWVKQIWTNVIMYHHVLILRQNRASCG